MGGFKSVVATPRQKEVAMAIRKRRSARSGRGIRGSLGRPSVARRKHQQRFRDGLRRISGRLHRNSREGDGPTFEGGCSLNFKGRAALPPRPPLDRLLVRRRQSDSPAITLRCSRHFPLRNCFLGTEKSVNFSCRKNRSTGPAALIGCGQRITADRLQSRRRRQCCCPRAGPARGASGDRSSPPAHRPIRDRGRAHVATGPVA